MQTKLRQFLHKFAKEKEAGDLHITRMFGAFVAVSQGKVIAVEGQPLRHCPLASMLYDGFSKEGREISAVKQAIAKSVKTKIQAFGHFTERREITRKAIAIPYGASEMLMYALKQKVIDCAVTVCDCAGTVVANVPEVVQGIGARMNGVFYTSPVVKVIDELKNHGACVVFPQTAAINQEEGVKKAAEMGYKCIAVTVNGYGDASLENIRKAEQQLGVQITILAVCTTGIALERAKELVRCSDLVWSCASGHVRNEAKRAVLQITGGIPIFVFTKKGLAFVSAYCSDQKLISELDAARKYFMSGSRGDRKVRMGKFWTYLSQVDSLPIRSEREPAPLMP